MATELAAAYVTLMPSLKGAPSSISKQLSGIDLSGSGSLLGQSLSSGISKALSPSGMYKLGDSITSALDKVLMPAATATVGAVGGFLGRAFTGGWQRSLNIEGAKRTFNALGMSAEEVESAMNSANEAVLGTAFGLDEAARAASLMSTSGVALGDDMDTVLHGITGLATMAGTSMDDITAIYQVAASQGKITGREVTRLAQRGINATDALAKHLGMTQAEVKELVKEGSIDFDTFASAMNEAFGQAAYGANETFGGSLMNLGAAMNRLGEKFAAPLQEQLKGVFNASRLAVNELTKSISPLVDRFAEITEVVGGRTVKTIEYLTNRLTHLGEKEMVLDRELGYSVERTITLAGSFGQAMNIMFGYETADKIKQVATAFTMMYAAGTSLKLASIGMKAVKPFVGIFDSMASGIKKVVDVAGGLGRSLKGGMLALGTFAKLKFDNSKLKQALSGMLSTAREIGSAFVRTIGSAISNMGLVKELGNIKAAFAEAFRLMPQMFAEAFPNAARFISGVKDKIGAIKSRIGSAFSAIAAGLGSFGNGFMNIFRNVFGSAGDMAKKVFGKLGTAASAMGKGLVTATGAIGGVAAGLLALGVAAIKGGVDMQQMSQTILANMSALTEGLPQIARQMVGDLPEMADMIVEALPPLIEAVTSSLGIIVSEVVPAIMPKLVTALTSLIGGLVPAIVSLLPMLVDAGFQLFIGLVQGLAEVAPILIGQLPEIVSQLCTVLVDNLPALLEAAVTLFVAIVSALVQVAPQIIAKLWETLPQLGSKLIEYLPEMAAKAGQLFGQIVSAIIDAAPKMLSELGSAIAALPHKIGTFLGKMKDAGVNLIEGFIEGIKSAIGRVYDTIVGGIGDAVNGLKSFLGIASPSKLFESFGQMTMLGLAEGISGNVAAVTREMDAAASEIARHSSFGASFDAGYDGSLSGMRAIGIYGDVTVIANDPEDFMDKLAAYASRSRAQYAK